MKNWSLGCTLLCTVAVASMALAQQQSARETPPAENALEEIVVTAQKRAENVQNVPIAISAITASALEARGITDLANIGGQAPNVTLRNSASFGGSSSILVSYIRGIGQNDFAFNLEPGVGVYVDGVYLARNIGANVDLLDLDRVEVLKGPQGTLFGRNTIGGAISIVTRDPGAEWKVKAEAITGSYSRIDFRGVMDAPLSDTVHTSIAISSKHRDGWQQRVPYTGPTGNNPIFLLATNGATGGPPNSNTDEASFYPVTRLDRPNHSGSEDQTAVRAKVVWTPTDKLHVKFIADYQHINQEAAPFSLLAVNQQAYVAIYNTCITGVPAIYAGVAALTGFPGIPTLCTSARGNSASPTGVQPPLGSQAGQHLPYDGRYVITNSDGSINPDRSYASGANFDFLNASGLNGQLQYDLTDAMQVKSTTGYRHLNSAFGADIGGAPFAALNPTFADIESQVSEELQLTGKAWNNRWNYVVGGYAFREYGSHDDGVPFLGGLIQINSPNNRYDTKAYAGFVHNNIDIIPDLLGITLGARYTKEKKSFTGEQRDENAFTAQLFGIPAVAFPNADIYRLYPLGENFQSFSNFSYRVGAELHATRDIMFYASYATGYKGGGWTTRLLAPAAQAPTFGPEQAKTAELGVKSLFWDHRMRLNAAVFNTKYDNIQLTFQQGPSPVTANGGNGRIDGAEVELNASVTEALSVDASVGYLDAKYRTILSGVLLTGNEKFVNTPTWTAQIGTSYRINMGTGTLIPRLDWAYASKSYNDEANTAQLATQAHNILNGSASYRFPNEKMEIQAGVTNITDKRIIVSGYTNALAIYSATFNPPREWFLTFKFQN